MVIHAGAESGDNIEEVGKRLKITREKVVPFRALQSRFVVTVKMDHLPNVGIVPSTKWYSRHKVLLVNEPEGPGVKLVIVITTEAVQTDAGLAESINPIHLTLGLVRPHGKGGTGEHCQRSTKTMAGQP